MNPEINKLIEGHRELVSLAQQFPVSERTSILFDKWSIQDILAHFSAWNKLDADNTEYLRDEKELTWVSDEDAFNDGEVARRRNLAWEEVFQEFDSSGKHLIDVFQSLPEEVWDRPCGPNGKHSPRTFLKAHIWHYHEAHIPSIRKVLKDITE